MSNLQPLISLIIPVYNVRNYLRECLDSVKAQTYSNISVVIVDDGSTDGSGLICDEYSAGNERFNVFHTANKGLSAARNYGLDHIDIETEYIAFLDSDDWMEPDTIQKLYYAASRTEADIVSCSCYFEYPGKTIAAGSTETECVLENEQILSSFIQEEYIGIVAWNKLYRVELFSGIRYPEGRTYEDVATTHKIIMKASKVAIIPYRLMHYRAREGSLSRINTYKSISDNWKSHIERYSALSRVSDDSALQRNLNGECLKAISRIWRWYYNCPKEDRKKLGPLMIEMQEFVREHCRGVISDNHYTLHQRATCLWAKFRNPILLRALHCVTLIYRLLKWERMYD